MKFKKYIKSFLIIIIMKKKKKKKRERRIFSSFRIKLLTGLYITIKVLIELLAHLCYVIKVYW